MKLEHKHILITGANGGIGHAFAKMCASHQAHLYLVLRQKNAELENELQQTGAASVRTLLADLTRERDLEDLLTQVRQLPLELVFNNAGLLTGGLLEEQPWPEIEKMLLVNVHALIRLTKEILPGMLQRGSGKIINNASVSGVMYFPCASTYAASKAAVVAFTECLEVELRGTGVSTLLLITPGIKTRMYDQIKPLYGKNLQVPDEFISPEFYAKKIERAIKKDQTTLEPPILTGAGIGLRVARHARGLFKFAIRSNFRR